MRFLLIRIFFLTFSSFHLLVFSQDIPNASFENWVGGEPVDWNTTNTHLLGFQFNVVNKETANPQAGLFSARLEVVTKTIPFVGTYSVPGVLTLSTIDIDIFAGSFNIYGGYPFTGMPQQLAGYLKYQPVGTDTAYFGFALSRWNNGVRDTIGYAADTIAGVISSWTPFQLPIAYDIWAEPDTMSILFLCTNVNDPIIHTGTKLWVDNLSFIYGTVGVEGITFGKDYRIYADAQTRELILQTNFSAPRKLEISLINIAGQPLIRKKITISTGDERIDTGHLPPGIYILRLTEGNKLLDSRKVTLGI